MARRDRGGVCTVVPGSGSSAYFLPEDGRAETLCRQAELVKGGSFLLRFLPVLTFGVMAVFPGAEGRGHAHEASKVRFVEHSPAAFDAARREGKPVFLLISAVWCYWCKYFEEQVLADAEVSKYLNGHYYLRAYARIVGRPQGQEPRR